jgi:hypothetical protein
MRRGPISGVFLAAAALAGCVETAAVAPVPVPPPRPDRAAPPDAALKLPATPLSAQTAAYYAQVQANLLAQGLMRTDGGAGVAFGARQLTDAFLNIAFYEEYASQGGRLVARATQSRMQRWARPVQIRIVTGPSVDPARAGRDHALIAGYAARLGRLTGHPVGVTQGAGNFTVLILTEDERRTYGGALGQLMPGLDFATRNAIIDMDPATYCLVVARDGAGSNAYVQAVAVIRAEHPDLLRLSCIHEELAQGLGLANDDPNARPSIFNDDEEFALLTRMDELMLRILYDARLRPGMTEDEARPIVQEIAQELLGGPV